MNNLTIHTVKEEDIKSFLTLRDFDLEDLGNNIWRVARGEELPVFISLSDNNLYFEVDLGNVSLLANEELYFKLLDLNTEILPVSFGINNSNPEDPRLVLAESRVIGDLSENELLSVFDAFELAADKAEALLSSVI